MKLKASEFMGRSASRQKVDVPTLAISRKTVGAASSSARRTVYGVETLDKAITSFDENERALKREPTAA